jgi:hypothetical protein
MTRSRLLSRFIVAAIIGSLWFAISSANDEPPVANSDQTKPESNIEKPVTVDSSMPDISGEWDMARKGSFGRCTVNRVTDGTADFHVYMNKQPWLKFKWLPKARQFQGTVIDKNGPFEGELATFTMTLDKTGQRLNVKTTFEQITPELLEAKKKELIKSAGVTQEEIDELFDMEWTRRKTFGQKLDGKPIQIVGNPKSNDQTIQIKEKKPEAVETDSSNSNSKPATDTNADSARRTRPSEVQPNSPSIPGLTFGAGVPLMPSIADLASDGSFPTKVSGDVKRPPFDRVSSPELLVIETKEGLSGYSTLTGTWDRVVVGLPKDGQPRLKQSITSSNFCSVIVDDQLFGFSSKAGKWGKLTIPKEYVGKVKPEHGWNMISATIGDRTFVLSPVTGKWTSSDGDSSSSVAIEERASLSDPQNRPTLNLVDAEQKLRLAVDTSESRRLTEAIAKHESQAAMIAEKVRTQSKSSSLDKTIKPTIEDLRRDVEASLSSAFELKLQLEKLRVKELQSRLSRLEQQIGRRQAQQKQIIERRTNELIAGEETEWNNDPNGKAQSNSSMKAEQTSTENSDQEHPARTLNPQSRTTASNSTQVRFLAFQGSDLLVPKIVYLEETIGLPARLNFERDSTEVRHYLLQIISGYLNPNYRPLLLDVYPANSSSEAYLSHNSVPFEITVADLEYVASGNFLTKVAYLPDSRAKQLAIANVETIVSSRLDPGIDPIVEADRRGTVLAALRFNSDENLRTEPTRWRPPQPSKLGTGQKSAFFYGVSRDGKNPHPIAVTVDENGVVVKSEADQNSESLVPVPVLFPSGDELAANLVSAREEIAAAQSEFLRQEELLKLNVTTRQEMANARRRLETATRKESILKQTYNAAIQDLQFQIEAAQADCELAETLSKQIGYSADMGESTQKAKLEAANKSVQARMTMKRLQARYEHYKKLGEGIVGVKGETVSFTSQSDLQPLKQIGLKLAKLSSGEMSRLAKTTAKYRGGLKILEVEPNSLAAENGIQKDDILVGLDKWETITLDNVSWIAKQVAEQPADPLGKKFIKYFIFRGTEMRFGNLPFEPAKETAPQETELDVLPKVEISR